MATYDALAVGTRLHGLLRRPVAERTDANKTKAMSFVAYAALLYVFPAEKARFDAKLSSYGFTPAPTVFDAATAQGVGNLAAQAVTDFRRGDGANQDGSLSASGVAYSDYTGYAPLNSPAVFSQPTPLSGIVAPGRWQLLTFNNAAGVAQTPSFLAAHWRNVVPFA